VIFLKPSLFLAQESVDKLTASLAVLRMTLADTFPATESSAILLLFAHTVLSPFFGSGPTHIISKSLRMQLCEEVA